MRNTDTVRISQETHYVSATEPNRLMLFRETVAVYCENHAEHRYSPYLTGNTLRLRYRAQPVMLFRETVAVYCENHPEHTDTVRISQETHYVSATEPNRLCCLRKQSLFTVRTIRNTDTLCGQAAQFLYVKVRDTYGNSSFTKLPVFYFANHTVETLLPSADPATDHALMPSLSTREFLLEE
jgi:hypothetical protein